MAKNYLSEEEVFGGSPTYLSDDEVFGTSASATGKKSDTVSNPLYEKPADAPAPVSAKKEPGLVNQVLGFFKPAPSVMEGYTPTPEQQQADVDRRLSYGAGPIRSEVVQEASKVKEGKAKSDSRVVNRVAKEMARRGEETVGEMVDRFKAEDPKQYEEQADREARRKFAERNPITASLASGAASQTAGLINAPAVAADAFNQTFVNPFLEAAGFSKIERTPTMFGTEYLQKGAADFMPKVGRLDMDKAYDKGEFGLWMMSKIAANSPQMAQSLAAAFVPPLRALLLPSMGATAAGSSFVEGDDSRVSVAKGLIEVGTEMLPLKVFDKLKGLPVPQQNTLLAMVGQRLLKTGAVITANNLTNAIEEVTAQFGGNVLDKYFEGKNVNLTDKLGEAAVIGGVTGNVMSLPQTVSTLSGSAEPRNIAAREFAEILNNSEFNPDGINTAVLNGVRTDGVSDQINPAATTRPRGLIEQASNDPIGDIANTGRIEPAAGDPIADLLQARDGRIDPTMQPVLTDDQLKQQWAERTGRAEPTGPLTEAERAEFYAGLASPTKLLNDEERAAFNAGRVDPTVSDLLNDKERQQWSELFGSPAPTRALTAQERADFNARTAPVNDNLDARWNAMKDGRTEPFMSQGLINDTMINPTGLNQPAVTNFTPADSPSAEAGLAPIVVPTVELGAVEAGQYQVSNLNQSQSGGGNVGTPSNVGIEPSVGGITGSDQPGGGVGVSGPSTSSAGPVGGADAQGVAANAGTDVAPRGGSGELPAGLSRPFERATDQDLLARTEAAIAAPEDNNADVQAEEKKSQEPVEQWFGRKGDGYVTEADASQALPGRERMFPELEWSVEQLPNGKFRLAGYDMAAAQQVVETAAPVSENAQVDQTETVAAPIAAPSGKPFSTEKMASVYAQQNKITNSTIVRSGDGWVIQPQETSNGTQTAQTQQAEAQGQEAPSASARQADTLSDLLNQQPALPDTLLAELSRNESAEVNRASVQSYLNDLVASGKIERAPRIGAPDAAAETRISALGQILGDALGIGNRVVAYSDPGGENGFALGNIAFVNTSFDSTSVAAQRTVFHEIRHVAEQLAAGGNKAAQEFTGQIDSIFADMTDAGKRAYITNFLHKEELAAITDPAAKEAKVQEYMTAEKTLSEMAADFLGNRANDREFLIDLARQDPKGFEGFVKRWLAVIDNMIAKLRGGATQGKKESAKVDEYVRDLSKAKMIARDALVQFRKGNLGEVQEQQDLQEQGVPVMSKRETVGEFDVRTMKDGTTMVYGDPEAIRLQIPDDVKGRVTKDGIMFTNSAGPRVKAALGGRTTAYSREGAVLDKLPIKDGKYVGAPEKFNTPGKIPTLRKLLRQLADEGAPGRYWYENSGKEVLKMVGGDMQEARKFVALLAIYSPQAKVDANSTFALRAWAQYKAGQPISVKTGSQDRKATEAMQDVDAFWKGEKTGNFFFNLLREIDPSTAGKQGATIDMWMMRAGQYENDAPTATQYGFMENETNRLAAELGWEPQQVQAAIWVAMKARMENSGVKKMTEASSEKKGWIRFERNAEGKKARVIINAQKHRDNWLKHSFEHDVTKDDTQQAKFDFGDGLKRHIGQVSFEARPGRTTGVLPGIHNAPYAQQVEFQQAVQKAFLDEQGNDILAMRLGLLVDNDILAPGVWQGEVSPSTQLGMAMAPAKGEEGKTTVDPAQAKALSAYAAVAGLVARQEGVGWHRPFYASTKRDANGLDINVGRVLNPREVADLEAAVGKWMADNGKIDWQSQVAFVSSPTGIRVVNFGIITNDILQSDIVKVAESVLPDFEYRVFASSGDMPTNNWKENPNGESYVQRISAEGRSDVLDWARTTLAPRVQRVFTEFSDKYGWGDAGEIRFSKRDGAGRDQGRSIAPLEGAPIVEGATGPDSRLVEVAEQYARDNGIDLVRQAEYVQVDPVRARRIANAYEVMRHAPQDPKVKEAFQNLIDQTIAQYRALESAGYKFYLFDETNDPYQGNPWNAMRELRNDQVMGVFATEAGFGSVNEFNAEDNPLLADTGIKWPYGSVDGKPKRVLANDLFRAVHDAFGHGLEGAGFRAQGEENAWQAHVRLFTGSAVGAITSETRGQNSWLNYGPNAERNQSARVEDTVFADQKTGLMPEWTWSEGRAGDMPAFSKKQQNTSPFYSQLSRAIEGVPERLSTQPASQWKVWLASNAAKLQVKKEEIEWTGINDYLDLRGKDKVSKADIAEYLNANGVQVEEVMNGGQFVNLSTQETANDAEESNATKYGQYQLPGGENYRELLLTLPTQKEKWLTREVDGKWEVYSGRQSLGTFASQSIAEDEAAYNNRTASPDPSKTYTSSHWDEKNVIAHIRFNDRTDADGNKVLFIEELQSDWGQAGRKEGFKGRTQEDAKQFFGISDADWDAASQENREAYRQEMVDYKGRDVIPAAPFVTKTEGWLSLGIKRVIAYAVDGGYDKVAFVNGQQSADRYDLSKQLSRVAYREGRLQGYDKNGALVMNKSVEPADLPDYVGKELGAKIAENAQKDIEVRTALRQAIKNDLPETQVDALRDQLNAIPSEYAGLDLKVGGKGMISFYDKIVPQTISDVLKKLKVGGKLEAVQVNGKKVPTFAVAGRTARDPRKADYTEQPGFSITDSMREKVAEGLPMFSKRQAEAEVKTDDEVVKLFTDMQNARGLKGIRAKEAAAAHPMGEQIVKINNDFYDILEKLDDAGLIEINC